VTCNTAAGLKQLRVGWLMVIGPGSGAVVLLETTIPVIPVQEFITSLTTTDQVPGIETEMPDMKPNCPLGRRAEEVPGARNVYVSGPPGVGVVYAFIMLTVAVEKELQPKVGFAGVVTTENDTPCNTTLILCVLVTMAGTVLVPVTYKV